MKADALKRAQAKKSPNRRRSDVKKAEAEVSIDASGDISQDNLAEPEIFDSIDELNGDESDGNSSKRERDKEARNERKAKRAADLAKHQKFVDIYIKTSDYMRAQQKSRSAFIAVEPGVQEDILSSTLAVRGPNLHLDRVAAARNLITVPKRDPSPTAKPNPDGYTECIIPDARIRKFAASINLAPITRPPQPRFKIQPSPIHGLGMFATRDLRLNDVIHSERPLLLTPTEAWVDKLPPIHGITKDHVNHIHMLQLEEVLEMAWDRMDSKAKDAYFALMNPHKDHGPFTGIKKANAMPMRFEDGAQADIYTVTYEHMPRLNHSCLPNAAIHFNLRTFAGELRALRDIKEGEEILASYVLLHRNTEARHKFLEKSGFVCQCGLCTDPKMEALRYRAVNESTSPVNAYRTSSEDMKKKMRKEEHQRVLKHSTTWVKKIEEAGMEALTVYPEHLEVMSGALLQLGRIRESLDMGVKRAKVGEAIIGDEHGLVAQMILARKLMAHPSARNAATLKAMKMDLF